MRIAGRINTRPIAEAQLPPEQTKPAEGTRKAPGGVWRQVSHFAQIAIPHPNFALSEATDEDAHGDREEILRELRALNIEVRTLRQARQEETQGGAAEAGGDR